MIASILKQDPNTKRVKRTLIYYDTDVHNTQILGELPFIKPQNNT